MEFSKLLYVIHFMELLTAILATVYFKKYSMTKEKYFLYFLWFTVLVDFTGIFWKDLFNSDNFSLFNAFTFVSFNFYFYWMFTILKSRNQKRLTLYLGFLFSCFAVYNFFNSNLNHYHSETFIFGSIVYIVLSLFFFSQLLNDKNIINVKKSLKFWIATGLLLFNVGMGPFIMFSRFFKSDSFLWVIIIISLNLILYTCYSLGFIWSKQNQN